MQRWVRFPGPGQFRGEGPWVKLEELNYPDAEQAWDELKETGFLPTFEGEEPPVEEAVSEDGAGSRDSSSVR